MSNLPQLSGAERKQARRIFRKYFRFLTQLGENLWPANSDREVDAIAGSFLLDLVLSKRRQLEQIAQGNGHRILSHAFVRYYNRRYASNPGRYTSPFADYVRAIAVVARKTA